MAGETIKQDDRPPRIFHAVRTAVPAAPVAVPNDPALPGLELLHRPEHLLAVLTPLLSGRLRDRHAELTPNSLFIRRYVPGKRCIVKFEMKIPAAPGMPDRRQCYFVKFYAGGHGADAYKNCQHL